MRFAPDQLCESELLNSMLLTDYILKFITTNQEVQGEYPFEQRPVAQMVQHLPLRIRQIFNNFHQAQHASSMHRFWIEAEEVDVSISNETLPTGDTTRIYIGELTMVVKKHLMERDIHGELQDVGNEDEGWPIYVLMPEQIPELENGTRIIQGRAMIYICTVPELIYWDNHARILTHIPHNHTDTMPSETLNKIWRQPRDAEGKVIQQTKHMPLIYRVTKEMARQSGLPHHYSPEFIDQWGQIKLISFAGDTNR